MLVLQPAEWSKPRGFSHGVVVDGPGKWIVLAGQTGGDEKGEYQTDMAGQVGTALKRIITLLGSAARDEREYADPDEFVWNRPIERLLSFGRGWTTMPCPTCPA